MQNFNESISYVLDVVSASVPESAPEVVTIPLYNKFITGVQVYNSGAFVCFVRINDGEKRVLPVKGWLTGISAIQKFDIQTEISGPPYYLTMEAYNTSASPVNVLVIVKTANIMPTMIDKLLNQEIDRYIELTGD